MRHVVAMTASLLVATVSVPCAAQAPSLRERAAVRDGKPLRVLSLAEIHAFALDDLAGNADVILEGHLVQLNSYLSTDEKAIYTDYQIIPRRMIVDRGERAATPSPGRPLVVSILGGEVNIEGTRVTYVDSTLAPFTKDSRLLLFLQRKADDPLKFQVYRQSAGMFIVQDERTKAMNKHGRNDEFEDRPIEEMVTQIKAAASRRR